MASGDHAGYAILREAPDPGGAGFYLVLGAPRGGTTLVALALARLGVFMGEKLPFTVEDPFLANMVLERDWEQLGPALRNRVDNCARTGWKFPQFLHHGEAYSLLPSSTRLLLVFRDVAATAIRGTQANATAFRDEAQGALRYHQRMLELLEESPFPALVLSYEKLLLRPDLLAEGMGRFTGIRKPELLARVTGVVQPSPSVYRKRDSEAKRKARSAGLAGCIDSCDGGEIRGWSFLRADPERVRELEFRFESGPVRRAWADLPRPDLKEAGVHPTGNCGFQLDLGLEDRPLPGEYIGVTDAEIGIEFEGSPFVYTRALAAGDLD